MLVFGGCWTDDEGLDLDVVYNDLWAYSVPWGWKPLTGGRDALVPPRRYEHSIVWDDRARRLLLFGGLNENGAFRNDLWEWTPGGWRQLTPNTNAAGFPSKRSRHGSVWDADTGRLLVFGGWNSASGIRNDLWQWTDTGGWREVIGNGVATSPSERIVLHAMVWDRDGRRMLLFGGCCGTGPASYYSDVWQYTRARGWSQLAEDAAPEGPRGRSEPVVVWDPRARVVRVFGGRANETAIGASSFLNDHWTYSDEDGWKEVSATGAPGGFTERSRAAGVWDPTQDRALLFGGLGLPNGYTYVCYNDLWDWRRESRWHRIAVSATTTKPSERHQHGAAWDTRDNRLLVFGGMAAIGLRDDLWLFPETGTNVWESFVPAAGGTQPAKRAGHVAVWDPDGPRLLVFGGRGENDSPHNDLWAWNVPALFWQVPSWQEVTANAPATGPHARFGHAAAWDRLNKRLFVFGGDADGGSRNDLWAWSTQFGWIMMTVNGDATAPPKRAWHAAAWDRSVNRLLVFGGMRATGATVNDLWEWSPAGKWRCLSVDGAASAPPRRGRSCAVWDDIRQRLLVFGGVDIVNRVEYLYDDLWAWTAGGWKIVTAPGAAGSPFPRYDHAAAWDPANTRLLVFGGLAFGFGRLNDLWEYR